MRAIVSLAIVLMATSHAYSQTAKETVNYLLLGYEGEEVSSKIGAMDYTYKPDASNPEAITLHNKGRIEGRDVDVDLYTYSLTQISDCKYATDGNVLDVERFQKDGSIGFYKYHFDLDFSSATETKLPDRDTYPSTKIAGLKSKCSSENAEFCQKASASFFLNVGDPVRLSKALTYFRQTYCHGSAF